MGTAYSLNTDREQHCGGWGCGSVVKLSLYLQEAFVLIPSKASKREENCHTSHSLDLTSWDSGPSKEAGEDLEFLITQASKPYLTRHKFPGSSLSLIKNYAVSIFKVLVCMYGVCRCTCNWMCAGGVRNQRTSSSVSPSLPPCLKAAGCLLLCTPSQPRASPVSTSPLAMGVVELQT